MQHSDEPRQFLTFLVGEEEYGIDLTKVREVKGWTHANPLPQMPNYMRGVLDLRGVMIPVFDVRARFSHHLTEATAHHVIIIVALTSCVAGLLIDSVSDIMSFLPADIKPLPTGSGQLLQPYMDGLATQDNRMVILLDVERLLADGLMTSGVMAGQGLAPQSTSTHVTAEVDG